MFVSAGIPQDDAALGDVQSGLVFDGLPKLSLGTRYGRYPDSFVTF